MACCDRPRCCVKTRCCPCDRKCQNCCFDCCNCSTRPRCSQPSYFRLFYNRGDLPVRVENSEKVSWMVQIEMLDYSYYLPVFFDGLSETEFPYEMISRRAALDMIEQSDGCRILPVIPKLILPIKNALATRDPARMIYVMKILQAMIKKEEKVGLALVPYYRQILPILNIFKPKNVSTGDGIVYDQRKENNIGDVIRETLELMEVNGGEDALVNIKYMVPTYESVVSTK